MENKLDSAASLEERGLIEAREQRVALARRFTLMSDVFMSVALRDKKACQYVLRILTGISDLVVKEVRTQYHISKIHAHDAILDVLAEDSAGRIYHIEIQRTDTIDHGRRVRFYAASVDGEYLAKGKTYAELPELFTIYISETDIWKAGRTVYRVRKCFENTDIPYDDGQHIIYVNAAVDDGSGIADLMRYFKTADPEDMSQGALSERVSFLKNEEGDASEMCEISEQIFHQGEASGIEKGKAIGIEEGKVIGIEEGKVIGIEAGKVIGIEEGKLKMAKEMALSLADFGLSTEQIAASAKVSVGTVSEWLNERLSSPR